MFKVIRKVNLKFLSLVGLAFTATLAMTACSEQSQVNQEDNVKARSEIDFNLDWKFSLNEKTSAQAINVNDSAWRTVRLPHDWSIEQEYTQTKTAGATGYLPGGEGWYRKYFATPNKDGITQILFDGVYNHSKVWINGHLLGERPYGYAPFSYDLTPYLTKDGTNNVIAVYVDRTRYVDSRWYTGSGIYRNVKLITTNSTYIPIWGNYITTPQVTDTQATVQIDTQVKTTAQQPQNLNLFTEILDETGAVVAQTNTSITLAASSEDAVTQQVKVNNPIKWDIENPYQYRVKTTVLNNDDVIDFTETKFGIRTFQNDPDTGFYLNGKNIKIKGVNLHHDAGLVGSAVPKGVWKRRLSLLKAAGVNAIRTAHNPPSSEFLSLCDEMGFLVQDEAFDEWENPKDKRKNFNSEGKVDYITQSYSQEFSTWAERDIKAMVMRDRNHPSIFQWSIGNEIEWTYPRYGQATGYWDKDRAEGVDYYRSAPPFSIEKSKQIFNSIPAKGKPLADTAKELSAWVKELDTTRAVTANMVIPSVSHFSGYADALDVIGYSYRQSVYEYGHKNYPDKMILGTENWVQWHEWQHILEKDYIPGIFVWTGTDYLGESNGKWPKKGTDSGMIDFAGFAKPSYHMMKTLWDESPHLFITTQTLDKSLYKVSEDSKKVVEKEEGSWKQGHWYWRDVNEFWQYKDGEMVIVEVYSNTDDVELFLNDKSLGIKQMKDNPEHILKWAVPYQSGELVAKSVVNRKTYSTSLSSTHKPAAVVLSVDKNTLNADGYDVSHIVAQLVDDRGREIKHTDRKITFQIEGDVRLLGVDNGAYDNIQKHQNNVITTSKGRALLILQSNFNASNVKVTAEVEGIEIGSTNIIIQ